MKLTFKTLSAFLFVQVFISNISDACTASTKNLHCTCQVDDSHPGARCWVSLDGKVAVCDDNYSYNRAFESLIGGRLVCERAVISKGLDPDSQ